MKKNGKRRSGAPKRKTVNLKVVQRGRGQRPPRRHAPRPSRSLRSDLDSSNSSVSAPAAVSQNTPRHAYRYSSIKVGSHEGIRIHSCIPIAQIGCSGAGNNGFQMSPTLGGAVTTPQTVALTPYNAQGVEWVPTFSTYSALIEYSWISPHIPLVSLAFDRYRVMGCTFRYEPQSTATLSERLVFSWTDDPEHPFLSPSSNVSGTTQITQMNQLITKDSVAFMPWKKWDLPVPVSSEPKFLYDLAGNNLRFSNFGVMTCTTTSGVANTYGILYVDLIVDLFDPVPIVTSGNIPAYLRLLRGNHHRLQRSHDGESKDVLKPATLVRTSDHRHSDEKDDEWDSGDAPHPKWCPPPSSAPGTPGYTPHSTPKSQEMKEKIPSRK